MCATYARAPAAASFIQSLRAVAQGPQPAPEAHSRTRARSRHQSRTSSGVQWASPSPPYPLKGSHSAAQIRAWTSEGVRGWRYTNSLPHVSSYVTCSGAHCRPVRQVSVLAA
ncbi:hypothetical protein [Streptomyces sp. A1547]|uniref:hypothetical protein n=1 Tax=Streptomyces sp. A1547 TaxID=2563105 RepID=UPI00144A59FA|nr:hypothetical protein [Streptomyces sp. A1547]